MWLKRNIPLAITFLTGIFVVITFFIPHPPFGDMESVALKWYSIIAGFTLILGVHSLLRAHIVKVRRRYEGWGYSIVLIVGFFIAVISGIQSGIAKGNAFDPGTSFMYLYNTILVPLQATMFSLLAFFIASASYRAFRAKDVTATLLLIAAIVVMLGRVPLGNWISPYIPTLAEWIMDIPQMAAKRGILIGIALGGIAMSLRIILGIERTYLS